ncbi:hypothetical protein BACCIP111895_00318 [Neobacillus rhizosphaerae]|uniref:Uncharacterized protein n=1 Tax=Neobacillus rhizosphaerae TaxID=2880965 RepID=A0ABM9EM69_9BACI|nr:hypothetical protein BACCIP111895_00318 [Neobacillus rhizosphaerae]
MHAAKFRAKNSTIPEKKGITINIFTKQLGVSLGY